MLDTMKNTDPVNFFVGSSKRPKVRDNLFGTPLSIGIQKIRFNDKEEKKKKRSRAIKILKIEDVEMKTDKVYVSESKLLPGQWGLFAGRKIRRDESVSIFGGDGVSLREFEANQDTYTGSGYFIGYPESHISEKKRALRRSTGLIPGIHCGIHAYPYMEKSKKPLKRIAGFSNHSTEKFNCANIPIYPSMNPSRLVMHLIATKKIRAHTEILWDYGHLYWANKEKCSLP